MPFKLTKAESKEKDDHAVKVRSLRAKLDIEFARAERIIKEAISQLNELAIKPYNEAVLEARDFVDTLSSGWREECENKSAKWQESDKAIAVLNFMEAWETFVGNIDDEPIAEIAEYEIDNPGDSFADDLDGLPSEAEE